MMSDLYQRKPEPSGTSTIKGDAVGKGADYDKIAEDKARQDYRKTKGFSGIAGVARMKQKDRDDESAYLTNWRKNKGQKAAVATTGKDTDKDGK
jgi:hypothetical protein